MMTETLVKVEHVSKKFCRNLKRSLWYGMKDLSNEMLGRAHGGAGQLRKDEFWALQDVNFELKRGECLGLIGRNGAGKTTLLRMLNGLIKPDGGRIVMDGRVGALIALGAGFNPILTGRENIYVNASVLGLSKKETDAKFNEIVEFAELWDFIDTPVQSYSSGMQVRLGFSIASTLNPDILLLDEVLAVGDIGFQVKCINRIRQMLKDTAVIFVSHNMQYVSAFCTRAIFMNDNQVELDAKHPAEAILAYSNLTSVKEGFVGTGEAHVNSIAIRNPLVDKDQKILKISQGATCSLHLRVTIADTVPGSTLFLIIMDASQNGIVFSAVCDSSFRKIVFKSGCHDLMIELGTIELAAGNYSFVVALKKASDETILIRHQGLAPFQVTASTMDSMAKIIRPVQGRWL